MPSAIVLPSTVTQRDPSSDIDLPTCTPLSRPTAILAACPLSAPPRMTPIVAPTPIAARLPAELVARIVALDASPAGSAQWSNARSFSRVHPTWTDEAQRRLWNDLRLSSKAQIERVLGVIQSGGERFGGYVRGLRLAMEMNSRGGPPLDTEGGAEVIIRLLRRLPNLERLVVAPSLMRVAPPSLSVSGEKLLPGVKELQISFREDGLYSLGLCHILITQAPLLQKLHLDCNQPYIGLPWTMPIPHLIHLSTSDDRILALSTLVGVQELVLPESTDLERRGEIYRIVGPTLTSLSTGDSALKIPLSDLTVLKSLTFTKWETEESLDPNLALFKNLPPLLDRLSLPFGYQLSAPLESLFLHSPNASLLSLQHLEIITFQPPFPLEHLPKLVSLTIYPSWFVGDNEIISVRRAVQKLKEGEVPFRILRLHERLFEDEEIRERCSVLGFEVERC